jgi:hypothetical protein
LKIEKEYVDVVAQYRFSQSMEMRRREENKNAKIGYISNELLLLLPNTAESCSFPPCIYLMASIAQKA